jgi:hypothetical protein
VKGDVTSRRLSLRIAFGLIGNSFPNFIEFADKTILVLRKPVFDPLVLYVPDMINKITVVLDHIGHSGGNLPGALF